MYLSNTVNFRSFVFDTIFVLAIPIIAIATAYVAFYFPQYFDLILLLDLTLLGYHHVISTYTRIASSKLSIVENRFLVFVLPVIVLAAIVLCAVVGSVWLIATIYLHWQWWHYTRQSEGIEKSIRFKTLSKMNGSDKLSRLVFYATPLATFLFMSSKDHATFLFMPVKTLPILPVIANVLLLIAACLFLFWLFLQLKEVKKQKISRNHFLYLISHHAIYLVAYVLFDDITIGWLAINVWHNAQYILFVWHFNNKFSDGIDRKHFIISWLSQKTPSRIFLYFSVCIIATFTFYSLIDVSIKYLSNYTALPLVVIAYQAVNFHHYVVDSMIWKIRKSSIRRSIGIDGKTE